MAEKEICVMKKPVIALIALAAAAAISTGAFLIVKNKKDNENRQVQEKLADNVLFSFDSETISEITIDGNDLKFTAGYEDGQWVMTETDGESFPLNQSVMVGICTYFSDLTADNNYGEITDEKKAKYGLLDDPYSVTVRTEEPDNEYTLYIGDISPTEDYYYAMAEGKKNIYAIPYVSGVSLLNDFSTLHSSELFSYSSSDAVRMTFKRDGETVYDLSRSSSTSPWELPEKYSRLEVDQTAVDTVLTVLTKVTAESLLDDHIEDIAAYGFDDPLGELTLYGSDGSSESVLISEYGGSGEYVIVLLESTNLAELYLAGDFDFVYYSVKSFLPDSVEGAGLYSISGFDVSAEDFSDSFTVDMTGGKGECRGTELDLANAVYSGLFSAFYTTITYHRVKDVDVDSEPEPDAERLLSVTYHFEEQADRTLELVQAPGENNAYIIIDGEYTGIIADTAFMTGRESPLSTYQTFCDQIGLEPQLK
ncbi:MAG: DUF4340 domain-containing protein [Ruminococcus sp.]|nr:DUF4340 domain-containing protein [Ruminococcus sp.]